MSNLNFLWKLTIVIPQLPCLFRIPKSVSSTVELVNSAISNSFNYFHCAIWAFASMDFRMELVPYSDERGKSWWQSRHMITGLAVSSIPHCKYNRHEGACPDLFQAIESFEHTFIKAHQTAKMICTVWLLKSPIKTCSFLQEIITSHNQIFNNFKSNIPIESTNLGTLPWEITENYVIVKYNTRS